MKKKLSFTLAISALLCVAPQFAFAKDSTQHHVNSGDYIVEQGDGYFVTAPKDNKHKPQQSSTPVTPNDTFTFTIPSNGDGSYDTKTLTTYSDGTLRDEENANHSARHYLTQSDTFQMSGYIDAWWSGNNPFNATSITMQPTQTVKSLNTAISLSSGRSASFSASGSTAYMSYPQVVINNNYQGSYIWDPWQMSTSGHFTSAESDAYVTWLFGTTAKGQLNQTILNFAY